MAKYDPIVCTYLPELFRQGASIEQVCVMLKISRRAWYDWCEKYPEFNEAAEQGQLSGDPEAPPVREITRTIIDPAVLREVRAAMLAEDDC